MSKFYGQVRGQSSTKATRLGSSKSGIMTSAQSYRGSIIVHLNDIQDDLEDLSISIDIDDGSSSYGARYFSGTLEELKMCFNMWSANYVESQPLVDCEELVDEL